MVYSMSDIKPAVSWEDFSRIDLRIARIETAERVPESEKLLKLGVDLGSEQRTILAGVGRVYEPKDLMGKRILIVANLEPRVILGEKSEGMLLAGGETPVLLVPEKEIDPGTAVR